MIFHRTMEKCGLFVANIGVVTYTPSLVKADSYGSISQFHGFLDCVH